MQFLKDHWPQIWAALSSMLFLLSEYLGSNPKIKSSAVYQFVFAFLQKEQQPKT